MKDRRFLRTETTLFVSTVPKAETGPGYRQCSSNVCSTDELMDQYNLPQLQNKQFKEHGCKGHFKVI